MDEKDSKSNKPGFTDRLLKQLLRDPTRSIRDIAKLLGTYRQKVWREKKKLEDENIIWGYTAVLDEGKRGYVTYLVLMKMKPMSTELADLIMKRILRGEPYKQLVRLEEVLYVNGEYDWLVKFTAQDHATARRYYDSLRLSYHDHLLEKPTIIDVNFSLVKDGKKNPQIKQIHDFVPIKK